MTFVGKKGSWRGPMLYNYMSVVGQHVHKTKNINVGSSGNHCLILLCACCEMNTVLGKPFFLVHISPTSPRKSGLLTNNSEGSLNTLADTPPPCSTDSCAPFKTVNIELMWRLRKVQSSRNEQHSHGCTYSVWNDNKHSVGFCSDPKTLV